MPILRRHALLTLPLVMVLTLLVTTVAAAHIESKTILVETTSGVGHCNDSGKTDSGEPCGAAVYGLEGFSGTILFTADEIGDSVTVVDYICVHTRSEGAFVSFGGSYVLKISEGGDLLDTATYDVEDGHDCTGHNNAVSGGFVSGATFTVPNDGSAEYSLSIAGITAGTGAQGAFIDYNSILNRVIGDDAGKANSPSVKPPTTFIIPEAPLAILLVVTGGLGAVWFVSRRMRSGFAALHSAD